MRSGVAETWASLRATARCYPSEGAAAQQDRGDRLQDDGEVQEDRPPLQVEEVEPDEVVEVEVGAPGDLPQAGEPGEHEVALLVPVVEPVVVALRERPGADERHLPPQHVEELRQL